MELPHLLLPYRLGHIELKNRVVMAPMTRSRALGNVPNQLMAAYYRQRAQAGLIITEGTAPAADGLGYARIPGLFNADHVNGWRLVTDAVHAEGSRIFVQLMHTGRVGHPLNLPAGGRLLAPSALALPGSMYTDAQGPQPHPIPQAASADDIQELIAHFVHSATLAVEAGFDGVELHGANGYLIDQFFNTASNHRQDQWGGSIVNRMRFAVEVAKATAQAIGADRVGIRISPNGQFNGMSSDPEMDDLFATFAERASDIGLVYLHVVDHSDQGAPKPSDGLIKRLRDGFKNTYVLSGGYNAARAEAALAAKQGDLVAFGRPFLANPRLVSAFRNEWPLRQADQATFYTPGEKGYTDYPLEVG